MITNTQSGTNVAEIAAGIFRINTPVALPGEIGFNFNQYLIVDEAYLETGARSLLHQFQDRALKVAQQRADVAPESGTFVASAVRHLAHGQGGGNVVG